MLRESFEFLINAFQPLLIRKTYILPLPWDRLSCESGQRRMLQVVLIHPQIPQ